jgi:tRNA G18 (ribose-2'-O)-methylase SpoU
VTTVPARRSHRFKLIIFNLLKPQNIGVLIRTAYAFGCEEVIMVGRKQAKLTGASGSISAQPIRHFFHMRDAASYCSNEGFALCGVEIGGRLLHEVTFTRDTAFVLGNEGRGLSDAAAYCEERVTIPQWGGVPSLNVAIAGAITMYTFQSQQGLPVAPIAGERFFDDFFQLGQ